jgi:hypothetical protein
MTRVSTGGKRGTELVDAAIYATDSFRLSSFKVLCCPVRTQHEW